VAERLLLRRGAPFSLGSRALDLLICLLEHDGAVVTPETLLNQVWRSAKVEPAALRVQVSALRKALGSADPGTPYIANVAGRGYAFVAPVSREATRVASAPPPPGDRPALPAALDRMVGREDVVEALCRTVVAERFVTVIGPGGIGKTTVAVATAHRVASDFAGDAVFVDLATGRRDGDVTDAVATALHLPPLGDDPIAEVVARLTSRRLLLVLDSCEHVLAGAAILANALYRGAPGVHVLATSREPLNAPGEHPRRLAALDAPPRSDSLSASEVWEYPAVQLFVERAAASGRPIAPSLTDARLVASICRKLDGIPLAIELAAGRVSAFGLATTLEQLDTRLRLSWPGRRTAPPRQLTLSATLDWSYNLLSADEAKVLRALSIFVGAFTQGDAGLIAGDMAPSDFQKALAGLDSKSLVATAERGAPVRYRLLDTTRDYARLKLEEAGELPATAARHADWTMEILGHQEESLDALPLFDLLDAFHNRLQEAQSALDWALSAGGDPSLAAPLTLAAAPLWTRFGRAEEGRRRIEAALEVVEPDSRDEMALNLALIHAVLEITPQDAGRIEAASARARHLAEVFKDPAADLRARWGFWNTLVGDSPNVSRARADALRYRELAAARGGPWEMLVAERMVAVSALLGGELATARVTIDRALGLTPTLSLRARMASHGFDPDVVASIILVSLLWLNGMPDTAAAVAQDALDRSAVTGNVSTRAMILAEACGALALCVGDLTAADRHAADLEDCVALGAPRTYRTWTQVLRATAAARRGDAAPGRSFAMAKLPPEAGHARYTALLLELALSLAAAGAEDVARDLADRLLQRVETAGERWMWSEVQRVRGELTTDPAAAVALFESALAVADAQGARTLSLRAATSLARRRPSAAADVLLPLLSSFTEGAQSRDQVEARGVLAAYGLSALAVGAAVSGDPD
jgi:predicted ATPase/DNA-binding winged helix-turn-helix (wHTH) protein